MTVAIDPLLNSALACVDVFYDRMFRDWPDAITHHGPGYTLSYSGDMRLTGANHLWLYAPEALTDATLETARAFFRTSGAAWSVIVTDSHMPEATAFLERRQYYVRWDSPLMVLDGPPCPLPLNKRARIIRVTRREHLDAMRVIMSEAFATQRSVNARVAREEHFDDPQITHYLCYSDGEPVACATVASHDEMAGVWNVGTRFRYRRQGFARTLMRTLLADQDAQGCGMSMLMASRLGLPLYRQLGYRQMGTTRYLGPPLARHTLL